jgi:putative salt-induced outer membrane protein
MIIHRFHFLAAGAALLMAAGPAVAQEEAEETGLSGRVGLGFTQSRGNTNNLGFSGDVAGEYKTGGKWIYDGKALFVKREENDVDTEERYEAQGSANYYWTQENYFYARLQYRKDLFGGVREEWLPTAGLGRILIDGGVHTLKGEVGAGYRWAELQDGTDQDGMVATGGLKYKWKISDSAEFIQNVLAEWSQDNTYVESETALRTTIAGNLGAKVSYVIKHNTDVAPDTANTDFYTTVGLDYAF